LAGAIDALLAQGDLIDYHLAQRAPICVGGWEERLMLRILPTGTYAREAGTRAAVSQKRLDELD